MQGLEKITTLPHYYVAVSRLLGKAVFDFDKLVSACSKKQLWEIARHTNDAIARDFVFKLALPHTNGYDVFASRFVMYNVGLVHTNQVSFVSEYLGAPLKLYGNFYICNMMQGNFRRIPLSLRKRLIAFLHGCKRRYGFYHDLRKLFCRILLFLEVDYMFFKEGIVEVVRDARTACTIHEKTVHVLKCGYHSIEFIDLVEVPMLHYAMKYWALPWFRWRRGGPKRLFLEQKRDFNDGNTWLLIFLGEYGYYLHKAHDIPFYERQLVNNPHWSLVDPINCSNLLKSSYSLAYLNSRPELKVFLL